MGWSTVPLRRLAPVGALILLLVQPLIAEARPVDPIEDGYIVVYKRSVNDPSAETTDRGRSLGFRADRRFRSAIEGFSARLAPEQLSRLRSDPEVAYVTPNRPVQASAFVALQSGDTAPTGVRRILTGTATTARQASGASVAVIDTGIDLDHPDLNAVDGTDCITPGTPADDDEGHGTHVAGSIAAKNNGAGVVGVAPDTKVYAVKVLNSSGSGSLASVICGIDWVTANAGALGIRVANMSLGGSGAPIDTCGATTDAEHEAICNSTTAGVNFVVAAGNDGWDFDFADQPDTPAAYPQVLTVTAVSDSDGLGGAAGASPSCRSGETDDAPASFSNHALTAAGEAHTIAGPGVCITSTVPGGYGTISGTSMASPHIAGRVALCINEGGAPGPCASLRPAQVISHMRSQAAAFDGLNPGYGFAGDGPQAGLAPLYGFLPAALASSTPSPAADPPAGNGSAGPGSTPADPTGPSTRTLARTFAKANLRGAKRSIRVRRGRFSYSFRAGPRLKGSASFTSLKRVRVSARRKVTLARKSFTVPASSKVTLRIKLSRKNLRILRRNRRITLRVTVKLRDAAGLTSTATRTLTLRI